MLFTLPSSQGGLQTASTSSLPSASVQGNPKTKRTERAVCRVVINAMRAGKQYRYIERSLNYFHSDNKPLAGKSIIILDRPSKELFQQSQSGMMSLYERLSDIGVSFIDDKNEEHPNDIHDFIKEKFGNDYLESAINLFSKVPLPLGEEGFNYPHFRAFAYQLFCPSYLYHHDKTVRSVAVIDAESFAPLDARNLSIIKEKSAMPVSLNAHVTVAEGNKHYSKPVLLDFQFYQDLYANAGTVLKRKQKEALKGISLTPADFNLSFKEMHSQKHADNLAKDTLLHLRSLIHEVRWAPNWRPPDKKVDILRVDVSTLDYVIEQTDSQLERLCYFDCPFFDAFTLYMCRANPESWCFESQWQVQRKFIDHLLIPTYVHSMLDNIMATINKEPSIKLCLDLKRFNSFQKKNFSILALDECKVVSKIDSHISLPVLQMLIGLKVKSKQFSKLAPLFSDPLNDWGVQGIQQHFVWNHTDNLTDPLFLPTIGKKQFAQLLDGNKTAFTSAMPAEQAIRDLLKPGQTTRDVLEPGQTTLAASVEGLKYGAASGLLDELIDRTGLLDCHSFIYSVARGYLFGQLPGGILSALASAYGQWVEPGISDGKLKSFLNYTVPKGFLLATAVQNPLGTACAFIGYQASRSVIQKLYPSQQPTIRANKKSLTINKSSRTSRKMTNRKMTKINCPPLNRKTIGKQ